MVTHSSQYLQHFDKIVVMNEGTIQHVGTFNELIEQGVNFNVFEKDEKDENVLKKEKIPAENGTKKIVNHEENINVSSSLTHKDSSPKLIKKKQSTSYDLSKNEIESDKEFKIIKKENGKEGLVDNAVYWFLFQKAGKGLFAFMLVSLTISNFLQHMGINLVLVDWGIHNLATCRKQGNKPFNNLNIDHLNPNNEICWDEEGEKCLKKADIPNLETYYNTTKAVRVCGEYINNSTTRCLIAPWVNTTKADMTLHTNSASLYLLCFWIFLGSVTVIQIVGALIIPLRLSRLFHHDMLKSLLAAKMRFFDTTTMGKFILWFLQYILLINIAILTYINN